jgi:hypothetical protein
VPPTFFGNNATSNLPARARSRTFWDGQRHATFGPSTVLEPRYGYARNGFNRFPESDGLT